MAMSTCSSTSIITISSNQSHEGTLQNKRESSQPNTSIQATTSGSIHGNNDNENDLTQLTRRLQEVLVNQCQDQTSSPRGRRHSLPTGPSTPTSSRRNHLHRKQSMDMFPHLSLKGVNSIPFSFSPRTEPSPLTTTKPKTLHGCQSHSNLLQCETGSSSYRNRRASLPNPNVHYILTENVATSSRIVSSPLIEDTLTLDSFSSCKNDNGIETESQSAVLNENISSEDINDTPDK